MQSQFFKFSIVFNTFVPIVITFIRRYWCSKQEQRYFSNVKFYVALKCNQSSSKRLKIVDAMVECRSLEMFGYTVSNSSWHNKLSRRRLNKKKKKQRWNVSFMILREDSNDTTDFLMRGRFQGHFKVHLVFFFIINLYFFISMLYSTYKYA